MGGTHVDPHCFFHKRWGASSSFFFFPPNRRIKIDLEKKGKKMKVCLGLLCRSRSIVFWPQRTRAAKKNPRIPNAALLDSKRVEKKKKWPNSAENPTGPNSPPALRCCDWPGRFLSVEKPLRGPHRGKGMGNKTRMAPKQPKK